MPKLTIDGMEIEVEPGASVLQACEMLGIEVPRFCYHDKLSVAGSCRMCLVEQDRAPKPIASCAMPCADGMIIRTNTEMVRKARRGVMELLLINHPLDCPICDQGGECDLQDQAVAYGLDHGRYTEEKRAVKEKDFGPLIKTEMTRCIHCTRCVRFVNEIAGVPVLGATNRGEHMEITTYVESAINSEMSGNLADVCPVGALTSKPYAYTARPWELRRTETIDVLDAVGSNIRVDSRGSGIMRVLPRLNEEINEEWISDRTRYAYDGLSRQRLDRPYVRKNGKLAAVSWTEALSVVARKLNSTPANRVAALAGDLCDSESMLALKDLMSSLGVDNIDCRQDGADYDVSTRASYIFNSTILGIEQSDAILLIGTNPRYEAALINARIRKRYLNGGLRVGLIGAEVSLNYPYEYLGSGPEAISNLIDGQGSFAHSLRNAKKPIVIVGASVLARKDSRAIQYEINRLVDGFGIVRQDWNGFNVLQAVASRVGGLDLGFLPSQGGKGTLGIVSAIANDEIDVVYLLGVDEIDPERFGKAFVVYQGHHGDRGAHAADVILPGAAYTEKSGIYTNTEGRPQLARQVVFPPGEAREDWRIIRALSEVIGKVLPYDNIAGIRSRLAEINPVFGNIDCVNTEEWSMFGTAGELESLDFGNSVVNYYMTDAISRASLTMAKCAEVFVQSDRRKSGIHG
ncbi:NADH-quinone oxidoreductase subunit G [Azospirillaceae bacterium]